MSGLLIFAKVEPNCAGPAATDGPQPVELDPGAAVHKVFHELKRQNILKCGTDVQLLWEGSKYDEDSQHLLADIGLCPESTVVIQKKMIDMSRVEHLFQIKAEMGKPGFLK
eukprot:Hpha_TRINITY_DN7599_c0_g1::TRINITY_DN7599_c0_g1_i1::g.18897::m.18897